MSAGRNRLAERSFEQTRPLTPPKQLFYDEGYNLEKDPSYKKKLSARREERERVRTHISDTSGIEDSFNINVFTNNSNRLHTKSNIDGLMPGQRSAELDVESEGSYMANFQRLVN